MSNVALRSALGGGASSGVIPLPTNVVGDVMVLQVMMTAGSQSLPAGWTAVSRSTTAPYLFTTAWKLSTGTEASVTWPAAVAASTALVYSNATFPYVDVAVADHAATTLATAATTVNMAALTSTGGGMLVWLASTPTVATVTSAPAGMVNRVTNTAAGYTTLAYERPLLVAGAVPAESLTWNSNTTAATAYLGALVIYGPPGRKAYADFNQADGALGNALSGQPWSVLQGNVTVKSNRAATLAARAIAVVDCFSGDITVGADTGSSGGYATYFRVSDALNWWRLGVRYYSYSYQSGTQSVLDHWECRTYYYNDDASNSFNYVSAVTSSGSDGSFTSYYPDGKRSAVTSCSAIYRTDPVYSTAYAYTAYLEKCVNNVVTTVNSVGIGTPSHLRVAAVGNSITCLAGQGGATPVSLFTATDAFNATATLHGLGYTENTQYSNSDGLDNFFAIAPILIPYVPQVML